MLMMGLNRGLDFTHKASNSKKLLLNCLQSNVLWVSLHKWAILTGHEPYKLTKVINFIRWLVFCQYHNGLRVEIEK